MSSKKVAVLGITGSIGTQTVKVVKNLNYKVVAASAGFRIDTLRYLQQEYNIPVIYSPYGDFDRMLFEEAVCSSDIVVVAISSVIEMPLVLKCLDLGKRVAIATKEMIILGAEFFREYMWKNLFPIDSEHATLYMLLKHLPNLDLVKKVILTASGGAFRDLTLEDIKKLSPKEALKHPVWNMGYKITVDSATLANKGIELMEARVLFDINPDKLDAVLQKEVIVHAMVELNDGFVMMGAYNPTMLLPIQFALTYPDLRSSLVKPVLWDQVILNFRSIPLSKYGMYRLAIEVLRTDDLKLYISYLIADEIVVDSYIKEKISFDKMPILAEKIIDISKQFADMPESPEDRVKWYMDLKKRMKEVVI